MATNRHAFGKANLTYDTIFTAYATLSNFFRSMDFVKNRNYKNRVKFSASNNQKSDYSWAIKTLIITFVLSALFNLFSSSVTQNTSIIVAFIILLLIISVGIVFDLIGTAITTAEETAFHSLSTRKIKGARSAIKLIRAKDKAANFCNDIIGDICGIISGSAAAAIIAYFSVNLTSALDLIISLVITGFVAALTVSGKALAKTIAIKYNNRIVYFVAKMLSFFGFDKKTKK